MWRQLVHRLIVLLRFLFSRDFRDSVISLQRVLKRVALAAFLWVALLVVLLILAGAAGLVAFTGAPLAPLLLISSGVCLSLVLGSDELLNFISTRYDLIPCSFAETVLAAENIATGFLRIPAVFISRILLVASLPIACVTVGMRFLATGIYRLIAYATGEVPEAGKFSLSFPEPVLQAIEHMARDVSAIGQAIGHRVRDLQNAYAQLGNRPVELEDVHYYRSVIAQMPEPIPALQAVRPRELVDSSSPSPEATVSDRNYSTP